MTEAGQQPKHVACIDKTDIIYCEYTAGRTSILYKI